MCFFNVIFVTRMFVYFVSFEIFRFFCFRRCYLWFGNCWYCFVYVCVCVCVYGVLFVVCVCLMMKCILFD